MFMMKYLTSSYNPSKKFYLNNYGNHTRDFTYINDVCEIMKRLIFLKKKTLNHEIYNICSNNPVKLISVIILISLFIYCYFNKATDTSVLNKTLFQLNQN